MVQSLVEHVSHIGCLAYLLEEESTVLKVTEPKHTGLLYWLPPELHNLMAVHTLNFVSIVLPTLATLTVTLSKVVLHILAEAYRTLRLTFLPSFSVGLLYLHIYLRNPVPVLPTVLGVLAPPSGYSPNSLLIHLFSILVHTNRYADVPVLPSVIHNQAPIGRPVAHPSEGLLDFLDDSLQGSFTG